MFVTICDKCKEGFNLVPKDLNKRLVKDDEVTYFNCPHCFKEYIYFVSNSSIKKKQSRLDALYKELQTMTDVRDRVNMKTKVKRLKRNTMKEVTKLKGKHERK